MSKRSISKFVFLWFVALGLTLSACGKPWQDPGPDVAFENFLLDMYMNKRESAFEALTAEDRERLTQALEELEGDVPEDALPEQTQMLVTGRVDNPYDLKDIEFDHDLTEEPAEGERVELELVYHDGREGTAAVVWGGDRWYVDLPEAREEPADDEAADKGEEASKRGEALASELVERLERQVSEQQANSGSKTQDSEASDSGSSSEK